MNINKSTCNGTVIVIFINIISFSSLYVDIPVIINVPWAMEDVKSLTKKMQWQQYCMFTSMSEVEINEKKLYCLKMFQTETITYPRSHIDAASTTIKVWPKTWPIMTNRRRKVVESS